MALTLVEYSDPLITGQQKTGGRKPHNFDREKWRIFLGSGWSERAAFVKTYKRRLSRYRNYFGENGTVFDSIFSASGYIQLSKMRIRILSPGLYNLC